MSQLFTYTKDPQRIDKLAGELRAAGVLLEKVYGGTGTLTVRVADAQTKPPVDAVVAAHDPTTPGPFEQAELDADQDLLDFKVNYQIGLNLLNSVGWDGMTPAQRTAFMRRLLKALYAWARRQI